MFEEHKAKKAAKEHQESLEKAAKEYQESLVAWQAQRDSYAELVNTAKTFDGFSSADGIICKAGEMVFLTVSNASLVEDRRGAGHYEGRSTGVSIPVGSIGGHAIRYRVGASRGHYEQGTPTATDIDTGTVYVTNQRMIFQGTQQTRECAFAKLMGFTHDDEEGSTTFSVLNRQKPTTVNYGPKLSAWFDFRLNLALAHYKDTVATMVEQMTGELADIDAHRPVAPTG